MCEKVPKVPKGPESKGRGPKVPNANSAHANSVTVLSEFPILQVPI